MNIKYHSHNYRIKILENKWIMEKNKKTIPAYGHKEQLEFGPHGGWEQINTLTRAKYIKWHLCVSFLLILKQILTLAEALKMIFLNKQIAHLNIVHWILFNTDTLNVKSLFLCLNMEVQNHAQGCDNHFIYWQVCIA